MEEYARSEEEATLELQTMVTQEERLEVRTEIEPPIEERRKGKWNAEEEERKQDKEDEADEFVSDKAFVGMENTMLKKDFIREKGFKQLISPFKEAIMQKGWSLLCEHYSTGFAALAR